MSTLSTVIASIYIIGAVAFFVYVCFDELHSFVSDHGRWLSVGVCVSMVWPVMLLILLVDRLMFSNWYCGGEAGDDKDDK